jgi:hypothetical protein
MALLLRNFLGKLIHGIKKKEFYGASHSKFSKNHFSVFAEKIYQVVEFLGSKLFYLLRIRYGSSILIYKKIYSQENEMAFY